MKNTKATTLNLDETLNTMSQKLGGPEHVPKAIRYAKAVAPELLVQVLVGAKESVEDENSPFDAKTRQLLYFTAALATNNATCLAASWQKLLAMGIDKAELVSLIKIVRQAAGNAVLGAATSVLESIQGVTTI